MVKKDIFSEVSRGEQSRSLSLPAMERVLGILNRLEDAGPERSVTCQWLGKELGVSSKTVQRDLDFLKDRFRVPLAYDARRHSWFLEGPVPSFFQAQLTEGELLGLVVAREVSGTLAGTRMGEVLSQAVDRLLLRADDSIDLSLEELREGLTIREGATVSNEVECFEVIREGMKMGKVLSFQYKGLNDQRALRRTVQPWHVAWVNGGWYLFGYDEKKKAERTFLLGRMNHVERLEQSFERPAGFSLGGRLRGSFGVFGAGREREQKVRLRFDPFAAQLVRERTWHESQQLEEGLNGEVTMELSLSSLEEVERWILSWGEHVEVLQPKRLRTRLAQVGQELVAKYGG